MRLLEPRRRAVLTSTRGPAPRSRAGAGCRARGSASRPRPFAVARSAISTPRAARPRPRLFATGFSVGTAGGLRRWERREHYVLDSHPGWCEEARKAYTIVHSEAVVEAIELDMRG